MALKDEIESIGKFVKEKSDCLAHNHILTNIWEGSLLQYILDDLSKQLSPKSYAAIEPRVSPINLAPQVIDKLSKIYTPGPKRTIVEGTGNENDQKLLSWYEDEMQMNQQMNIVNELFNLHKSRALLRRQ